MFPHCRRALLKAQLLSKTFNKSFMSSFDRNRSWSSKFEVFNDNELPNVDENTYYEMKVAMNNNGHVKIKTALKEPGKEWNINSKEYQEQSAIDKSQKKTEALDEAKSEQATTSKATESTPEKVVQAEKGEMTSKESKKEKGGSPKKYFAPFDEIHGLFRNIERDFENSMRKKFDLFDDRYESEAERNQESGPFDEMDAIFKSMQKDFEKKFGSIDQSWRRNMLDQMRSNEDEAIEEKESKEKKESKEGKGAQKSA